jgi:hypothetical protein
VLRSCAERLQLLGSGAFLLWLICCIRHLPQHVLQIVLLQLLCLRPLPLVLLLLLQKLAQVG